MKGFITVATSFLLVGLISSHVIPQKENFESGQNNDTLVFANVIFRHGEREEPDIPLTNEGKRQLYMLGEYFHKRYSGIIGGSYSPEKVYILSTDYDRAIMSAEANLAGFFKPTESEIWNDQILWQPIPVHTLPKILDNILRPRYGDRCPKYGEMYDWYMTQSPEALEMLEKYNHLFPYWEKMTGFPLGTIEDVFSIYKWLVAKRDAGKPLEDWEKEAIVPDGPMDQISKAVYKIRGMPKLARIRCGFLIKEMYQRCQAKANGMLVPNLSLYIYSAHSSTITTLMNGLRLDQEDIPDHGSSFQFELYRNSEEEHYIQLFLRKPDEEYPEPKEIPGCGKSCPLDKFYSIYEELIPGNFEDECRKD